MGKPGSAEQHDAARGMFGRWWRAATACYVPMDLQLLISLTWPPRACALSDVPSERPAASDVGDMVMRRAGCCRIESSRVGSSQVKSSEVTDVTAGKRTSSAVTGAKRKRGPCWAFVSGGTESAELATSSTQI